MNTLKQLNTAENELAKLDPVLGKLIKLQKPVVYTARNDYFSALCRAIIGQQVSVAAAAAIFARFESITKMKPEAVIKLKPKDVKTIGLSRQKTAYLTDLAQHFIDNPNIYDHLDKLSDEEVITDLTKIKGIGLWSAQMFLIFTLGRLDVFAPDDVGLQRAMKQLYGWESLPTKAELIEIAEKWRPYRTVACWHLWKSLHNTP